MNTTGMLKSPVLLWGLSLAMAVGTAHAQKRDTPATTAPTTRAEVDRLLGSARQAIQAGHFAQAEQLVARAEGANVSYPLMYFGDTPAKLRRELVRAQQPTVGLAGSLRRAFGAQANEPIADPFLTPASLETPVRPAVRPAHLPMPEESQVHFDPAIEATLATLPAIENLPIATSPGTAPVSPHAQQQTQQLLKQARSAMQQGNLQHASQLVAQASALNVPESQFAPGEDRPSQVAWELQQQLMIDPAVRATSAVSPLPGNEGPHLMPYEQRSPPQRDFQVAQLPSPSKATSNPFADHSAQQLLAQGEEALRNRDRARALQLFQAAAAQQQELDAEGRQRVENHLQMLTSAPERMPQPLSRNAPSGLSAMNDEAQVLARQLSADVGRVQSESRALREKDPKQSLEMLEQIRSQIIRSGLGEPVVGQLLRRVDLTIVETEKYVEDHRAELELDEQNKEILAEIDRRRQLRLEMQGRLAELVDEFNRLRDEQRFHEMEQVAQRLQKMAPDDPVVQQVWQNAKFIRRNYINQDLASQKEGSYWQTLADVDASSIHTTHDGAESVYPTNWSDLTASRRPSAERNRRRSPREIEIEQNLRKPVLMSYENEPLAAVLDDLSKATGVSIVLDPRGLSQEGVASDTRVSLKLTNEISLKSALNLILEPLHLSYVVKDEVLKVTSEQLRDGELYAVLYNVADLVVPIPNFVPDNSIGLQGLINDAHAAMGYGSGGITAPGPMAFANNSGSPNPGMAGAEGQISPTTLAQVGGGGGSRTSVPFGGGGGGLGGSANADFDSLIDLITSTVASDTWAENGGGEAEIRPFETNLSLVVSQTQAVHEQIADLLEQLRRLQDLQVTIEVRFIRLNDSFFERIGIDFDMNIEDRTSPDNNDLVPGVPFEPNRSSSVVGIETPTGLSDFPRYTADLDVPFRQNSFNLAVPQFGSPVDVASFGFAILSDIEAYFLINASQGDQRSNVLNAPKVTLFNGQQAFVADTSQTPFVISVIPVVGEFAAAQQPVIVVLSEGTLMTIQAVVSDDRRYVRLTVVPFFSEIGDVDTFTFEGSTSTSSSSSTTDDNDDGNNNTNSNAADTVTSGTTVQLPTFQFITVTTTVSVPDGGTVLLGGIKRLREGRNEFGVPLLSKVPYINRLFRNVGIGRETDSLMMMVTPRIIIQEEEEARLLGTP